VAGLRKIFQNARSHFKIRMRGLEQVPHNPKILGLTIKIFKPRYQKTYLQLRSIVSQTENFLCTITFNG
jgi:hypothetical protein